MANQDKLDEAAAQEEPVATKPTVEVPVTDEVIGGKSIDTSAAIARAQELGVVRQVDANDTTVGAGAELAAGNTPEDRRHEFDTIRAQQEASTMAVDPGRDPAPVTDEKVWVQYVGPLGSVISSNQKWRRNVPREVNRNVADHVLTNADFQETTAPASEEKTDAPV